MSFRSHIPDAGAEGTKSAAKAFLTPSGPQESGALACPLGTKSRPCGHSHQKLNYGGSPIPLPLSGSTEPPNRCRLERAQHAVTRSRTGAAKRGGTDVGPAYN